MLATISVNIIKIPQVDGLKNQKRKIGKNIYWFADVTKPNQVNTWSKAFGSKHWGNFRRCKSTFDTGTCQPKPNEHNK